MDVHIKKLFFFICVIGLWGDVSLSCSENKTASVGVKDQADRVPCKGRLQYSCNKHFSTKGNMLVHFKAKHLKLKPYSCKDCGRPFAKKQNMLVHRETHKNIQKFKCYICGKSFSQKGNMRRHLDAHSEVKRFSCNWCNKRFNCNDYRKRHEKICKKKSKTKLAPSKTQLAPADKSSKDLEKKAMKEAAKSIVCSRALLALSGCASFNHEQEAVHYDKEVKDLLEESSELHFSSKDSQGLIKLAKKPNYDNRIIDFMLYEPE